jgi:flagellar biosynthesis/type III secretory pathway M-ring protein FliF/YscJ
VLGDYDYESMRKVDKMGNQLFFVFFFVIFFALIMPIIQAIILATYEKLRREGQETIRALAELFSEKSGKIKEKWVNLLLFRTQEEQRELERQRLVNKKQVWTPEPEFVLERKEKNYSEIFLYNMDQLGVSFPHEHMKESLIPHKIP